MAKKETTSVTGKILSKRKVGPEKTAVQMQCTRGAMALRGRGVSAIPTNAQGSAAYRRLIQKKTGSKPDAYYRFNYKDQEVFKTSKGVVRLVGEALEAA